MRRLLLLLVLIPNMASAQMELKKTIAYGEFLGAGEFYSLNIERTVMADEESMINARFGLSFTTGEIYFIPGANYLKPIGENGDRFLEIGAGAGAVLGTSNNGNRAYGYLNFGYRKQSTDYNPLFWRATFTPLLFRNPRANAGFLGYFTPSIGVAVGYGF
ncbi:MAG: hypothetical protein JKY53_06040 [Flavobacteriales bacterium]|nr:hypothetical protein [Flavobacteriales bacterium]